MTTPATPKTHPAPAATSPMVSRRQFIQFGIGALGAAWLGLFIQSRLFPNFSASQAAKPVEFALSELPVGGSKTVAYGATPTVVIRTPESVRAFSLVCTHLGCQVQWQEGEREFYCPCHDGRFDEFGEVVSGPPPVPLESLPVTVVDGRVIIGEAA